MKTKYIAEQSVSQQQDADTDEQQGSTDCSRFRIRLQIMQIFLQILRRKQKKQNVFRKSRQRLLLQLLRRQRRTIAEAVVVMEAVVPEPASSGNVVSGSGYFTHPCPGMTYQSSYFGEVRSFDSRPHKGNDYAAPTGTPTYAAAAGTVITAGWSNSAGNWVVISHGNGLVTKYMHHSSICVSAGQRIAKGQQIGYVGSTGYSTGAHLHFQVELNGRPVNPNNYM